ncbi:MAG: ABC transporter permease subunit [Planctomycetota bacterium]|nr:ABC transporter permease subunit [Planctomycetota bacterium]
MNKWWFAIRGKVPLIPTILLGIVPILVLLGLWWFLTAGPVEERRIGPSILPSPAEVFSPHDSIGRLVVDRHLVHHALVSLRRIALGFCLALCLVVPTGILMGAFGSLRALLAPLATAGGYIPIATLVPLTMSWFGTDERQKIVFLAMAFGIYLLPMVVKAIDAVPEVYLRTATTLGANSWQIVLRVLLPISLPDIWHGMRLAFGVGWTYLVLTEVVVVNGGLGDLIFVSQRRGPREHVYLVILVITLIAWASDLFWVHLGRLLFGERRTAR